MSDISKVSSAVRVDPPGAQLLSSKEAAALIGVEYQTVRKWHSRGKMLVPYKELNNGPVWWDLDLIAWAKINNKGKWKDRK
jgi:hypothetical protein